MKNVLQKIIANLNKEFTTSKFIIIDNNMNLEILLKLINNMQIQKEVTLFYFNNRATSLANTTPITTLLTIPRDIFYITIDHPSIIIGPYLHKQSILAFFPSHDFNTYFDKNTFAINQLIENDTINLIKVFENIIYLLLISHANKNDLFKIDFSNEVIDIKRTKLIRSSIL